MHEYGKGAIVSSTIQGDEGVGNLHNIKDNAREKKFILANVKTMNVRADDINWSNTIFTSPAEGPRTTDLRSFTAINEKFLATMPPSAARSLGSKTLFVTTNKAPDGEEILTLYTRAKEGHWVGFARSVTNYKTGTLNELQWHLNQIGNGGRLYVYGDDLPSVDFTALADRAGVDTIRRAADVEKRFVETNRRLNQIADRPLKKATTTLVNGVPATAEALASAGLPESGIEHWRAFHDDIEKHVEGHYDRRITGKSAFIQELTNGSSDMILIVAHSDGPAIYIGKDRITLDELQKLPRRNSAGNRARVAFLLSCDTGKLTQQQAGLFRSKMNSLATILVERNFVDQVVAPDHTIAQDETLAVLRDLLSGKSAGQVRNGHAGWQKLAVLRRVLGLA
jgi:hypothetical protein